MKNIIYTILTLLSIYSPAIEAYAQLADVTYSVQVGNIRSKEGGFLFGPCWENGSEEYTGYGGFFDEVNGAIVQSSCLTCNSNGNCNYGGGSFIGSRTNGAYQLYYHLDAWEDDNGSRCSFNSGDDCRNNGSAGFLYFREYAAPSNGSYAVGPQANYGSHELRLDYFWKYAGSASLISTACASQTSGYSPGAIRSWSVNLVAGRTYRFSTIGLTSEDTYLRIIGTNGFSVVGANDDFAGVLQSQLEYTAPASGTYYIELSAYSSSNSRGVYLLNSGSLRYEDITTPAVNGGTIEANATLCTGGSRTLSSSAQAGGGFDGTLTYTWEVSSNGVNWSTISGANGATYNTGTLTNTSYYRRKATDCKGTSGYSNTVTISVVADPVVTITPSAPDGTICSGGSTLLTANASGGTGPIQYQWQFWNGSNWQNTGSNQSTINASPSITRDYRILISTNVSGCNANTSQTVTVVADPVFTVSGTDVTCNGLNDGTATATISGGTNQTYQFNWFSDDGISSNNNPQGDGTLSVSGLFPGSWVIQTINQQWGCFSSANILISEPSLLSASTTIEGAISCNGGTTEVTVSGNGGTAPYTGTGTFTVTAGTYSYIVTDVNGCTATTIITVSEPAALVVSSSASDYNGYGVSCNGGNNGSISVWATGGTAPYSGIGTNTGLNSGVYSYIVTDANGCTASTSNTITEPALLTADIEGSDFNGYGVSCYLSTDGTADAIANGGVSGYSYSWNTGATSSSISGLAAGSYAIVVTDANGCTANADVSLTEPTKVNISVNNTSIACFGGYSDVTVTTWGGATPYSVDDAGTFTMSAGSYTYLVVDANGCSASTTIDITQPTLLTVNAGPDETVFFGYGPMECADLSATSNGGTGSVSYSWTSFSSGGGTGSTLTVCPTSNEVYTVTVVDANGCVSMDDLSVCVIDVQCEAGNSGIMKVEMCQVPPGNPSNAHTICVDASAVPAHLAIGCQLGECGELESACTGLAAKNMDKEIASAAIVAYPNPTSSSTTISVTMTKSGNYSIELFDMMGKLVKTVYAGSFEDYENLEFDVDMTNLQTGVYMISVSNGEQKMENIRVMKN